jgi:UDP-glucose 6-dehydrogenase
MIPTVCFVGLGNIGSALYESHVELNDGVLNFLKLTCDIKEYKSGKWKKILENPIQAIFLCLPANNTEDQTQDMSIYNQYFDQLIYNSYQGLVFICSTILPLSIKEKYRENLKLVMFPQFVNERQAINEFKDSKYFILGSDDIKVASMARRYILKNFNFNDEPKIDLTSIELASYFKYLRNFKMAWNVTFWNYVFDFSLAFGFDYRIIKEMMSEIPVNDCDNICSDGYYGFGGTCLPKDLRALDNYFEHDITQAIQKYNLKIRND